MKVRVEIEMPVGCKDCPFYRSGELYEWCRYNEYLDGTAMQVSWANREKKPDNCPLNDCVRVADITVKNNPPTVIDADGDKKGASNAT